MSNQVSNLNDIFAYSQIIQGTLIFLSALVGVAGYVVQSKMKGKERQMELDLAHDAHLKQLRLERTREQLSTFAGPASMYTMAIWQLYWEVFNPHSALDRMGDGKIGAHAEKVNFSFQTFIKAKTNEMETWIGPELEETCRTEPKGEFAVHYRGLMKRVVFGNAVHLSKLLKLHSGHLSIWTTVDEFKERYPCAAKSGWARNLFFLQFCNWTDEFVDIIENQWGNEDYTLLFPKFSPYPCQITPYLLSMVTKLREIEVKLGASDRKVVSWEDEKKKLPDTDEEIKKKTGALKAEVEKEKKKKYVVSAAAAGVAAGVTKLVTDSV